ncbi:hypothetical protein ABT104_18465 [Streptomyces mobaraensis]|uniref:hypothetical protein n=1 Tax=Streptomyces mobaraensis TaxID=35621 RepID=UPI00331AD2C3
MNRSTAEHGVTPEPQRPRCQEYQDIKHERAQALEAGDRQTAARVTETMSAHLWKVHV